MGDSKETCCNGGGSPEFVVPKTWADRAVQNYMDTLKKSEAAVEDAINPPHYQRYKGLEVIDITEQLNFCLGNATKYILRAGHKPGNSKVQDLEKAKWYIEREIRRVQNEDSN